MVSSLNTLIALTGYSDTDAELLAEHYSTTSEWIGDLSRVFYDVLYAHEKSKEILGTERSDREATLKRWYLGVASGKVDEAFWRQQWVIGLVHILQRVDNASMMAMMSKAQLVFLEKCVANYPADTALVLFGAFKRTTDVIAGLIAEGFFINFVAALENTAGFKLSLISRMMDIEVRKLLLEARKA